MRRIISNATLNLKKKMGVLSGKMQTNISKPHISIEEYVKTNNARKRTSGKEHSISKVLGFWQIYRRGANRRLGCFSSKKEAIKRATELCVKNNGSLYIEENGKINWIIPKDNSEEEIER